jgi:hypothetical protein
MELFDRILANFLILFTSIIFYFYWFTVILVINNIICFIFGILIGLIVTITLITYIGMEVSNIKEWIKNRKRKE